MTNINTNLYAIIHLPFGVLDTSKGTVMAICQVVNETLQVCYSIHYFACKPRDGMATRACINRLRKAMPKNDDEMKLFASLEANEVRLIPWTI